MLYLIDGYNLLFALGVLRDRTGPERLEKARLRLLGFLHGAHGDEAGSVTVVFDAAKRPPGLPVEQNYQGIHVVFAARDEAADDLIEQFIRRAPAPQQLAVVSDDHRIQRAGLRRRCVVLGCNDYLDLLDRRRRPSPPSEPAAKPRGVSREEAQHWLKEFADLAEDPDMREVFDPHGFLEEERRGGFADEGP